MRKMKSFLLLAVCLVLVFTAFGCGKDLKPVPEYNVAVKGRTVDTSDPVSVIENALLVDVYEQIKFCEAIAVVYEEYSKKQDGKATTYYVVSTVGGYIHEDGKLVRGYGNAPFAAVITLKQNGEIYEVVEFKAGRGFEEETEYETFVAENFPEGATFESLMAGRANKLFEAEKQQIIKNYGFDESEFSTGDENIELLPVTNEAYYTLVEYFPNYPDWLGTTTRVEEGVRYTYTTSYVGEDGGKGVVTYVKANEAGEEAERYDIKVDGDNVELPEEFGISESEINDAEWIKVPGADTAVEPEEGSQSKYTPEEIEQIMENEFNYDDGIEYTLVD